MGMTSMKSKRKKRSNGDAGLILLIFSVCVIIAVITLKILFSTPSFRLTDTAYAGNGIYNTFFMNGTGIIDPDIPAPETGAETSVTEQTIGLFGSITYSSSGTLITGDGDVVIDHNKDKITFPASLTKIMTAIIAIENVPDLSAKVVMDKDIFEIAAAENASIAGFSPGEEVTVLDLLYGTLLASGADASLALARYVTATDAGPGSEEMFVALMNEKAAQLGLEDTSFANCTGLHNPKHYSTAYEMAMIFAYALKNETFRKIITETEYTTAPTGIHPDGIKIKSTVESAFEKENLPMYPVLGGKTGYTPEAKLCLASFATIDYNGVPADFILVTLGAGDGTYATQYNAMDAYEVFRTVAAMGEPQPVSADTGIESESTDS